MHLLQLEKLHPSSIDVSRLAPNLFSIAYPGLILIISVRHLLAFHALGQWNIVTGHLPDSKKLRHEEYLIAKLGSTSYKSYPNRKSLVHALRRAMAQATLPVPPIQ